MSGFSGLSGVSGLSGFSGLPGLPGSSGLPGSTGADSASFQRAKSVTLLLTWIVAASILEPFAVNAQPAN
ncbi:MAG: MFS transporter, partial [Clostridia bacterium]|nr:MFS transporter [Clostridia bacterium]